MGMHIGMAGEVRTVVRRADGTIKVDTGYQKNLILNKGLDFFGGVDGGNIFYNCVIGTGNSTPVSTQTQLDAAIKGVFSAGEVSSKVDYNAALDGDFYKTNLTNKYIFSGFANNTNVTEVGLASSYIDNSNYYLCTRALIKDTNGNPTVITLMSDETLEIYYKVWQVFSLVDKTGVIQLEDNGGVFTDYNYIARMAFVGGASTGGTATYSSIIGDKLKTGYGNSDSEVKTGNIGSFASSPSGSTMLQVNPLGVIGEYTAGQYKVLVNIPLALGQANGNIRSILMITTMGFYQFQFSSVANASPITKANTQKMTFAFEFSWGRYEGAL